MKVLVVDDDVLITKMIVTAVGAVPGVACTGCESVERAMELLSEGDYDVVLADIEIVGGRGGDEIKRYCLAHHPQTKVLFMSGHPRSTLVADGTIGSEDSLLKKPFGLSELLALLPEGHV